MRRTPLAVAAGATFALAALGTHAAVGRSDTRVVNVRHGADDAADPTPDPTETPEASETPEPSEAPEVEHESAHPTPEVGDDHGGDEDNDNRGPGSDDSGHDEGDDHGGNSGPGGGDDD